jgi:hypothetical protein
MDKEIDGIKDYVFSFECSVGWENLDKTDDEKCRFCHQCNKTVYFVETQTELNKTAKKGNCVAFPNPNLPPDPSTPVLGGYILPPEDVLTIVFTECKVCKTPISKADFHSVQKVCEKCQKSDPLPKKSWWQFWK